MSFDDDSLIMRTISPEKLKGIRSNIQEVAPAPPTIDIGSSKSKFKENHHNKNCNTNSESEDHEDADGSGNDEVSIQEDHNDDKDKGDKEGNARRDMNGGKIGTITTSAFSVGSISSLGVGSPSAHTNVSVSSSIKDSIMNRLLLNIAIDPEPFEDFQSTLSDIDLPDIERPRNHLKKEPRHAPPQCFPNKSLPTELLEDFITYMKESTARKWYEMGKYSDVTLIIMNYALKKHLLLKKYMDPEQLNLRWMFEFWRSKEVRMPSLHGGGRNEYSQTEERAIERGLYKYPPFKAKDVKGKKFYNFRWNKIFWDDMYHEALKKRSPQSIRDKARGTRNREGESIIALYHLQCKYRSKLQILLREFSIEIKKKKMEIVKKKKNLS